MKWITRLALTACLAAAGTAGQAETGAAQRQLAAARFTIISPFPPGGPVDVLARILGEGLAQRYGQPAVVENLPGAAGNLGMERVRRARPDGHTLLVIPAGNLTINPTLMPDFPFDMARDFTPVTMLAKAPNVLVAGSTSGIASVQQLIAQAKAAPDTLAYASPGIGSGLHLAGELFKQQTGTDILHVAYKGTGPALNDVLAGVVPLMFTNLPAALPHIQAGKLKALATTSAQRTEAAPEIPTLAELGVGGIDVTSWYGLLAPAGLAPEVADQLARDAAEILARPQTRQQLAAQGMTQATQSPAAFAEAMRQETGMWAAVIRARGIRAE